MRQSARLKKGLDRIVGAAVLLPVLAWMAFAWETATGTTFSTRGLGKPATAERIAQTRSIAVTATLIATPLAVLLLLRRR